MIRMLGMVLALLATTATAQEPAPADTYYCGMFDYLIVPSDKYGSPRPRGYGGEACLGARPAGGWIGYEVELFHDVIKPPNATSRRRSGAAFDLTVPFQFEKYKPFLLIGAGGENTNLYTTSQLKMMYQAGAGFAYPVFEKARVRFEVREVYQRINGVSLFDLNAKLGAEIPFGGAPEQPQGNVEVVPPAQQPQSATPPPETPKTP